MWLEAKAALELPLTKAAEKSSAFARPHYFMAGALLKLHGYTEFGASLLLILMLCGSGT